MFFFVSTVLNFASTVLNFASTVFFFVSTVLNFASTVFFFVSIVLNILCNSSPPPPNSMHPCIPDCSGGEGGGRKSRLHLLVQDLLPVFENRAHLFLQLFNWVLIIPKKQLAKYTIMRFFALILNYVHFIASYAQKKIMFFLNKFCPRHYWGRCIYPS